MKKPLLVSDGMTYLPTRCPYCRWKCNKAPGEACRKLREHTLESHEGKPLPPWPDEFTTLTGNWLAAERSLTTHPGFKSLAAEQSTREELGAYVDSHGLRDTPQDPFVIAGARYALDYWKQIRTKKPPYTGRKRNDTLGRIGYQLALDYIDEHGLAGTHLDPRVKLDRRANRKKDKVRKRG